MDKAVFSDKEIEETLTKSYIPVKVNIDDLDGFELKLKYKVSILPTFIILDAKGGVIDRIEETLNVEELNNLLQLHSDPSKHISIKHDFNISPGSNGDKYERNITKDYLRYVQSDTSPHRNYTLQVGYYSDYESASDQVESLKKSFLEPIIVTNEVKDNKVQFNIMMGEFDSIGEAEHFKNVLKNEFQIDAKVY